MLRARRLSKLSVLVSVITCICVAPATADVSIGLRTTGVGAAVQMLPTGRFTSCNSSGFCFYHFAPGTTVTLQAVASANGGTFSRWLGACAGSGSVCTVTLDVNKSATARFSPVQLFMDEQAGRGAVSVSPVGRSCGSLCWEY